MRGFPRASRSEARDAHHCPGRAFAAHRCLGRTGEAAPSRDNATRNRPVSARSEHCRSNASALGKRRAGQRFCRYDPHRRGGPVGQAAAVCRSTQSPSTEAMKRPRRSRGIAPRAPSSFGGPCSGGAGSFRRPADVRCLRSQAQRGDADLPVHDRYEHADTGPLSLAARSAARAACARDRWVLGITPGKSSPP
jgi:hypothetical protein